MADNADEETPESFICPLTLEIMTDPVTAADGHSYECAAITTWLRSSALSPLTGEQLPHKQLTRSHALRNAIQEHQQLLRQRNKKQQQQQQDRGSTSGSYVSGAKVILLGNSNAGKSSLVHRLKEGTFNAGASQPTIGCSFVAHTVTLPDGKGPVELAIWDTAGQEKYRSFTKQYFRGAVAAILLYDVTSAESFEGLQRWLADVRAELPTTAASKEHCALFVIGAKVDREDEREVPIDAAKSLASEHAAQHLECSSKTGLRVEELFASVAGSVHARGLARPADGSKATIAIRAHSSATGGSGGLVPVQVRRSSSASLVPAGCCQQ